MYESNRHTPVTPMNNDLFKPLAAIACGCLLGFALVGLAHDNNRVLAKCEQRGGSVAECRLLVLGR